MPRTRREIALAASREASRAARMRRIRKSLREAEAGDLEVDIPERMAKILEESGWIVVQPG